MRGYWDHDEPATTQETPEDNTTPFIREQIDTWKATGILIHPEVAMEIVAWYISPKEPGLCAFATKSGKITDTLLSELLKEKELDRPESEMDELDAVIAYVRAVTGEDDEELIRVFWNPNQRVWSVSARASADSGWSVFNGSEDELDTLLSLARDVATGG